MDTSKLYFETHTISDVLGFILITPPSTASRTAHEIFSYFPFDTYDYKNGKVFYKKQGVTHAHTPYLFEGHEKYKLILTTRNPYAQYSSRFMGFYSSMNQVQSSLNFKDHFTDFIFTITSDIKNKLKDTFNPELCWGDIDKEITYKIRVENISEDYKNIPFIKESELNLSGKLDEILNRKIGNRIDSSQPIVRKFPSDWREYWSDESAENFYSLFHRNFERWGYDKDSWKK